MIKVGVDIVTIDVLGTPAPKGSSRAFYKAGMKRAVIVKDNSDKQKSWDSSVRGYAATARTSLSLTDGPYFIETSLAVELTFRLLRPNGHWRPNGTLKPSSPMRPLSKPDIDKLARSTLDSLTGIIFDDDSRITELLVRKVYARAGEEGARIVVRIASA